MTKSMARNELEASKVTAARQEAMEYKVDVLGQEMGDMRKEMSGIKDQLNRMEILVQRLVNSQARVVEARNMKDLRQSNLESIQGIQLMRTPEGNFKFPPTGPSVVVTGWDVDPLPHAFVASPTLNNLNPNSEPDLARQWKSYSSNDRVHSFYIASPEFNGVEPLLEAAVQKKETTMKPFTPGVCKYCGYKGFCGHKCKHTIGFIELKQDLAVVPINSTLIHEVKLVSTVKDKESVCALAMNYTGSLLVTGDTERVVRIWDPGSKSKNMKWGRIETSGHRLSFNVVTEDNVEIVSPQAEAERQLMQISVKISSVGKNIKLNVKKSNSAVDVKEEIERKVGLLMSKQILLYTDCQLEDNQMLSQCDWRNGQTLLVWVCPTDKLRNFVNVRGERIISRDVKCCCTVAEFLRPGVEVKHYKEGAVSSVFWFSFGGKQSYTHKNATQDTIVREPHLYAFSVRNRGLEELKLQLEVFSSCVVLRLSRSRYGAHFHMKQGAVLYNLEAQMLPKNHHGYFIRLTLEYFKFSSLDADEISACKYVILSKNVLAAFVRMNSTMSSSKEPGNIVFHILTEAQNFYAMKLWYVSNIYKETYVHVINYGANLMRQLAEFNPLQFNAVYCAEGYTGYAVVFFTKDWNETNQHGKYIYGWLAKEEDYKSGDPVGRFLSENGDLKTVADLLPLKIRQKWAEHFKKHDILYLFWSVKAATVALEGKKISGYSMEDSNTPVLYTKIYGRDELLVRLQGEVQYIVSQKVASTAGEDHDSSSSDSVLGQPKHVVVGFVGYPNVGKSSTINALVGQKRTGVTSTPGKTRHFQILIISEELMLCDCPGLVFPSFLSLRHERVACGDLPIDGVTKHRGVIQVVACQEHSLERNTNEANEDVAEHSLERNIVEALVYTATNEDRRPYRLSCIIIVPNKDVIVAAEQALKQTISDADFMTSLPLLEEFEKRYMELTKEGWEELLAYVLPDLAECQKIFNDELGYLASFVKLLFLESLTYLNLSSNNFKSGVPSELGRIIKADRMDPSYNEFSGPVPASADDLEHLLELNLSKNHHHGSVPAGSWVLIVVEDTSVMKTATICPMNMDESEYIFRPLHFNTLPTVKLTAEPLNPSELPKMVECLRKISKSYPPAITKVEESGEHIILETGELYLDSIRKDQRELYSEVEVKVEDPVVTFCKTVVDISSMKCFAETPNQRNKVTMVAKLLEKDWAEDIENGLVNFDSRQKEITDLFQQCYQWDVIAARSIGAFEPEKQGPNILLDENLLNTVKCSMAQGVNLFPEDASWEEADFIKGHFLNFIHKQFNLCFLIKALEDKFAAKGEELSEPADILKQKERLSLKKYRFIVPANTLINGQD